MAGALTRAVRRSPMRRLRERLRERTSRFNNETDPERLMQAVNNALLAACEKGYLEEVKCLVEEGGACVEFRKRKLCGKESKARLGKTPVELACYHKHWKVAKYLASRLEPSRRREAQRFILCDLIFAACEDGDLATVKRVEEEAGQDILSCEWDNRVMEDWCCNGKTPLEVACYHKNWEVAEYLTSKLLPCQENEAQRRLLESNMDRRFSVDLWGAETAFHGALHQQDNEILIELLHDGVLDVDTEAVCGGILQRSMSLLHHACGKSEAQQLVLVLLQKGANPNARCSRGETPLAFACHNISVDHPCCTTIANLVKYGANPNARDRLGNPPLMKVLTWYYNIQISYQRKPFTRAVKLLLQSGADPNFTYRDGKGPLVAAVKVAMREAWLQNDRFGSRALGPVATMLDHGALVATRQGCAALEAAVAANPYYKSKLMGLNLTYSLLHAFVGEVGGFDARQG